MNPALIALLALTLQSGRVAPVVSVVIPVLVPVVVPVAPPAAIEGRLAVAIKGADAPVEYSDWYYRRLTVHRWGSYTMLPLFAAQYWVGAKLYGRTPGADDGGAKDLHGVLAAGVAGLFAVNTFTGLWNLWDGRHDPNDRKRRFTHATLMLLADAGFVATGVLADGAEGGGSGGGAGAHRAVAIGSMAVSTVGWLMMTELFRK